MQYLLFTGKNCAACPVMKKNMIDAGMSYIEIDVDTIPGRDLAKEWHIMSRPTLAVVDMSMIDTKSKKGIPIRTFIGAYPVSELHQIMKDYDTKPST